MRVRTGVFPLPLTPSRYGRELEEEVLRLGMIKQATYDKIVVLLQPVYVPDDYPTIQAAVAAASHGDTIIVRDGTYTENVDVNKEHLTI